MNFKLALGLAVAIVAFYCILVLGFLRKTALYDSYHVHVGIAISVVGVASLAVDTWKRRRNASRPVEEGGATTGDTSVLANSTPRGVLLNARFVGVMAVSLGLATVFTQPLPPTAEITPIHAAERPKPPPAKPVQTNKPLPVVEPVKPVKAVKFPPVRLQGIYYKPERPSALINGKTYFIGELVGNAKVVTITRDFVILELEGQQHSFTLEP